MTLTATLRRLRRTLLEAMRAAAPPLQRHLGHLHGQAGAILARERARAAQERRTDA